MRYITQIHETVHQALAALLLTRGGGGEGTPYHGLYGEAPPKRATFFRLHGYEKVGISLVEVYKRVGKSVIWVCKRAQKG